MLDARRCLVVGRRDGEDNNLDKTEVLDIATMTFTAGPVLGSAGNGCAAVSLDSTHILVVGGGDHEQRDLSTTFGKTGF